MGSYYNQQSVESDFFDLGELVYQCRRNLVKIIAVTIICALIAYIGTKVLITPTYSASADLIVNNQQIKENATITNQDLQASTLLVNTCSIILKSHVVLEKVIHDLDLPYSYGALAGKVSVTAVGDTQVMRITVTDESSEQALRIVSALADIAPEAIMNAMDAGSVKTVDNAWTTGNPVGPNVRKNAVSGGMLGLVLCLVVIVLRMLYSNTFKTEADIREVLDSPILAIIPLEEKGGR